MGKKVALVLIMVLIGTTLLFARPTKGIAVGAQVGPLATGVVVDFPLGPVSFNFGVNTPLMINYIKTQSEDVFEDAIAPYFMVSADITYPIHLGEHFDLKFGISTLAGTDFKNAIIGIAGGTVKGEYWIPNKKIGIFMHMDVPVVVYFAAEDTFLVEANWLIPLLGVFTTTAGVLWAF